MYRGDDILNDDDDYDQNAFDKKQFDGNLKNHIIYHTDTYESCSDYVRRHLIVTFIQKIIRKASKLP